MPKNNIIIVYSLGFLSIIASGLLYMRQQNVGFPDGNFTELDRAEKPLFLTMCFILLTSGLFLVYLARFAKWKNSNILFYYTMIFLFAAILISISLDMYFSSTLENGGGG